MSLQIGEGGRGGPVGWTLHRDQPVHLGKSSFTCFPRRPLSFSPALSAGRLLHLADVRGLKFPKHLQVGTLTVHDLDPHPTATWLGIQLMLVTAWVSLIGRVCQHTTNCSWPMGGPLDSSFRRKKPRDRGPLNWCDTSSEEGSLSEPLAGPRESLARARPLESYTRLTSSRGFTGSVRMQCERFFKLLFVWMF